MQEIAQGQNRQDERRRWFMSRNMDLVVWYDRHGEVTGFQLCYDKQHHEKALTWSARTAAFTVMSVDDGENAGMHHKASPVLVPGGEADIQRILADFEREGRQLPREIRVQVLEELAKLPVE